MRTGGDALLRPDDGDAFRQAVRAVRRGAGMPVSFGGQAAEGALRLSELAGVRTNMLKGLQVRAAAGLGGRVLTRGRPAAVSDYATSLTISHDYDAPVLAEGISSVVAAPVLVGGAVRGVLYGAARGAARLGDRAIDVVVGATRHLADELAVRDEVDRRLRLLRAAETTGPREQVALEEVRELHAEFRAIAQGLDDPALRDRLHHACDRLAGLASPSEEARTASLTPRELDVLSQVALGCTNAEAGKRLSLRPETAKAYLRSAMHKLDVHNRHEAVVAARRQGLLP
ncbi:LuxR C-terminal-related transcriptional regulator [Saccharopolyspora indica]|uniref:LuxR C-terminal-related transcriptional regulator n=1 Tax=Saccharopolyspora indica TaxID=1229659 RepID=UPI0022EA709D|nr:LuxR C-terminal-related transcriptional regulator [Saccharopolyspora indica]MDA3645659.1 LuxR C-terminal-related transcriptional regulator [Saccharopolyspora indica]